MAGFVIQHITLPGPAYYCGPNKGWIADITQAIHYTLQSDAQTVIDLDRMYAVPNTDPPSMFGNVFGPASSVAGHIPTFADNTGKLLSQGVAKGAMLSNITYITTPGAGFITLQPDTLLTIVDILAAGGGSGGCATPTAGHIAIGGSGGSGGIQRNSLFSGLQGAAYVVGAGGVGGAAGANAGAAGGDTTIQLTGGGALLQALGGSGGPAGSALTGPGVTGFGFAGFGTNGDINLAGQNGFAGMALSTTVGRSGQGGSTPYAGGGQEVAVNAANTSAAGQPGQSLGAGASGAAANGTAAAVAGADGAPGAIIIYEFK